MNKTAIKNFAIWARVNLIEAVKQRAYEYEITKDGANNTSLESVGGRILSTAERDQRRALINKISEKGFDQVMEEAAYTWFNRFIALRFMEVNGYLPARVRVFTNEEGEFKPEIMKEAMTVEIEGLNRDKVLDLIDKQNNEELFKYLIITQCNALGNGLPKMFEKIEHWTELLFPANLLRADNVVGKMVSDIPEEDFSDIEIIGWMYQYYITEPHERIVNPLHGKAYTKEEVPAATQIFTTEWVVKYIVDNSLGRYWIERNPESSLKDKLEYLVVPKSGNFELVKESIRPQDITVLDPCVGSGHFLSYAFEVLMMIYTECGWSERDAAKSIVENNLFGIDIDERAGQLAYFTIMMKARKYNRRALAGGEAGVLPNIYAIIESNNISRFAVEDFCNGKDDVLAEMDKLLRTMKDAKEYGSIIEFKDINFELLLNACDASYDRITLHGNEIREDIIPLIKMANLMSKKYDIVVTNPPYMNKFSPKLKDYINAHYAAYKGDLFSVFIYKSLVYCKASGYAGLMTPNVWMFIKSYEELRKFIIDKKNITTLVQMAKGAFFKEATVDVCGFVLQNAHNGKNGQYIRLEEFKGDMDIQGQKMLEALLNKDCGYYFETPTLNYLKISGSPIAYWVSKTIIDAFQKSSIGDYGYPKQGFATGDNNRFLRFWHEVGLGNINFNCSTLDESDTHSFKWYPCNKGGEFRRWYGNNYYLANWQNNGKEMRDFKGSVIRNPQFYFKEGITWSSLSSGGLSMRYSPKGFIFESKGSVCFMKKPEHLKYLLGLTNSKIVDEMLLILSPTLDYHEGPMSRVPVIMNETFKNDVDYFVSENIELGRGDWDSFETSWDFKVHPMIKYSNCLWDATAVGATMSKYYGRELPKHNSPLELCYLLWQGECNERFNNLKANEEELNRIFIDIYGLQDELTPNVADKDVTVRKADLGRDIRSFISYAVGCIFGRYSLNAEGLCYAGGEWNETKYQTIIPDRDNILPICDDEYFEDDIVGKFINFVEVVYGKETLEENLKFIASALGGKGTAREVIRAYFLNDFYTDHLKIYQKRPIYWMFDSGKKNGFKALIYMHRYQPDLLARMRTDYVHEQQERYRTQMEAVEEAIAGASPSEKVKLTKKLELLRAQSLEIGTFEEKVHHLADMMISIDLDDGVKVNYAKFEEVLAKIK